MARHVIKVKLFREVVIPGTGSLLDLKKEEIPFGKREGRTGKRALAEAHAFVAHNVGLFSHFEIWREVGFKGRLVETSQKSAFVFKTMFDGRPGEEALAVEIDRTENAAE